MQCDRLVTDRLACLFCSYWAGKLSEDQLLAVRDEAEVEAWQAQQKAGINRIGLDGTLYDQILDIIYTLGLAPSRFQVRLDGSPHSVSHVAIMYVMEAHARLTTLFALSIYLDFPLFPSDC